MKTNIFSRNISIIFIILILLINTTTGFVAYAEPDSGPTQGQVQSPNRDRLDWDRGVEKRDNGSWDVGLPNATMEDAENWVDRKGYDVISLLQKSSQTIMVVIFIIGAFMAAMGGKRMRPAGFLMMLLAVISQSLILFAPELMDFFQNWIAS